MIIRASVVGTVVFVVAAALGTISLDLAIVTVIVSLLMFVVGIVVFLAAYARAIGRSRYEEIGMGGLFFLAGSAPRRVQVILLSSFAVEVIVAVVCSSLRVYTPVAFTILAPMYGIGLSGLWGARHGTFGPRRGTTDGARDTAGAP
jgi:hypothetical protein